MEHAQIAVTDAAIRDVDFHLIPTERTRVIFNWDSCIRNLPASRFLANRAVYTKKGTWREAKFPNGKRNPPDVYLKEIWVPQQNQANRVGMVPTAESL